MLFNSPLFVFAFLPLVFGVFAGLKAFLPGTSGRRRSQLMVWITIASLFFYEYWDPKYLALLGGSIGANYWLGRRILECDDSDNSKHRWMLLGIALNLSVLAWFKYAGFLVTNANALLSTTLPVPSIVLPLAVSFITFQKIAFLVDCRRGVIRTLDFETFIFFVSFFPPLIAGPIVHYREFEPQVRTPAFLSLDPDAIMRGLLLFLFGLAKKVLLADTLAIAVRDALGSGPGGALSFVEAWRFALSYTLQIYLDFSGYSNMAIGLALMFGIALPLNFNSPYQATSLVDFWQRWHMTLSRFLRDYVYIPLGGNRRGRLMRYRNLLLTMLLGGLWHGAGWTFVLWGALHGVGLAVNHAWREWRGASSVEGSRLTPGRAAGWLLTFLFVVFAWIPFRVESLPVTLQLWRAMAGLNGQWGVAIALSGFDTSAAYVVQQLNISWYWTHQELGQVLTEAGWLGLLLVACLRIPPAESWIPRIRPGLAAGVVAGAFLFYFIHLNIVGSPSEFIYFHF